MITAVLVLLFCSAFCGAAAAADPQKYTGQIKYIDDSGKVQTGTAGQGSLGGDWYAVSSVDDLKTIAGDDKWFDKQYVLTRDIDCSAAGDLPSIGYKKEFHDFKGKFYGNGYKIIGFTQGSSDAKRAPQDNGKTVYHGLFGWTGRGAELNYIQMVNCRIYANEKTRPVGCLVGYAIATRINGCSIEHSEVSAIRSYVGALAGCVEWDSLWYWDKTPITWCSVKNCYVEGDHRVGGMVGDI